jgi:hypothetical protein
MPWYCLLAAKPDPSEKIHAAWVAAARIAAKSHSFDPANAVFRTFEPQSEDVAFYFSPAAKALALEFGAVPCKKPSPAGIGVLVGDRQAWAIHFPGETNPLTI